MSNAYRIHAKAGLSLFELLVVLLIMAIVATFALPLTTQWYQRQMTWTMQKDIEQAIEYGIQKSHILSEPLRIVPLSHHHWSTGLRLIRETKGQRGATLYVWPWRMYRVQVNWRGFFSNDYLRFMPELDQLALNGYFAIERDGQSSLKVIVNKIGRVRVVEGAK